VVAEDMLMFRELIVKVCREAGHEVVGATGSGAAAVELCRRLQPDILVLDLVLDEMDGCAAMEELARRGPPPQVLLISAHLADYLVYRVERSIARGFVDKNVHAPSVLTAALSALAEGRTWFSPTFVHLARVRRQDPHAFDKILTDAELRFLQLVARGFPDLEIAGRLGISVRTAQGHRSHILHKLGLENTPGLMVYARDKGFTLFGVPPVGAATLSGAA
jgi:DNA-binding NarL/FixJ family response regulator